MKQNIFFPVTAKFTMPNKCIGCAQEDPDSYLRIALLGQQPPPGMKAKILKGLNIAGGLAYGGPIGAIAGAAVSTNRQKTRPGSVQIFPVCSRCKACLTHEHLKEIDSLVGDTWGEQSFHNPLFEISLEYLTVRMAYASEEFSKTLLALNPCVIYQSYNDLLAANSSATMPGETGSTPVPTIRRDRYEEYNQLYKRELSSLEAAIVESWRTKVGSHKRIYSYPDIPTKIYANAIKKYAPIDANEIVLGLQDDSLLGSGKDGILFSISRCFFIHKGFIEKSKHLFYSELDPSLIKYEIKDSKKNLILNKKKKINIVMVDDQSTLLSLSSFLVDAATLSRT